MKKATYDEFVPFEHYPKALPSPQRTPVTGKKSRLRKHRGKRVMPNGLPKAGNVGHLPDRKNVMCKPGIGGGKAPYYECGGQKVSLPPGMLAIKGQFGSWIK